MKANYLTVKETDRFILIRDVGPWSKFQTITNAAEDVVEELREKLNGRRLLYYDSLGDLDEILIEDGRFIGFKSIQDEDFLGDIFNV